MAFLFSLLYPFCLQYFIIQFPPRDELNKLTSIINEEGITEKSFKYDLHGNIIKEIDNEGNATLLKYDLIGNIIEKRVPVEKADSLKYNVTYYNHDKNSNKILEKHGTTLVEENEIHFDLIMKGYKHTVFLKSNKVGINIRYLQFSHSLPRVLCPKFYAKM